MFIIISFIKFIFIEKIDIKPFIFLRVIQEIIMLIHSELIMNIEINCICSDFHKK